MLLVPLKRKIRPALYAAKECRGGQPEQCGQRRLRGIPWPEYKQSRTKLLNSVVIVLAVVFRGNAIVCKWLLNLEGPHRVKTTALTNRLILLGHELYEIGQNVHLRSRSD